ncbi:hypothetical protein FHS43_002633 [Streptosporangium becharense]|uniref:Uncharacterized protein n=1 Tax=Streptosporangium becharense TaxID=1816182 RepID=A0A7W9IK75_9ACTN|nr:hypothetical protein [Streptosporangium becharense]MBB5821574.1 hypothetical protein [Streptosporangium becharense]
MNQYQDRGSCEIPGAPATGGRARGRGFTGPGGRPSAAPGTSSGNPGGATA